MSAAPLMIPEPSQVSRLRDETLTQSDDASDSPELSAERCDQAAVQVDQRRRGGTRGSVGSGSQTLGSGSCITCE